MKTPMKTFAIAAASFGLVLTSTPAFAAATNGSEAQLSYDDLDLSTPEGQRELDRRIDKLAKAVCGADEGITGSRLKGQSSATRKCVKEARASAKQQMATIIEDQQRGG